MKMGSRNNMPLNRQMIRKLLKENNSPEIIEMLFADEGYHRGAVKQVIKIVQAHEERRNAQRDKSTNEFKIRGWSNGSDNKGRS